MLSTAAAVSTVNDTPRRSAGGSTVTPRELYEALDKHAEKVRAQIDSLRLEVTNARHDQTNRISAVIAAGDEDIAQRLDGVDGRIRTMEVTMAQSNPTSLGPRIGALEGWKDRMDGDTSAPTRLAALESVIDQMRGSLATFRLVAIALGALSTALAIYAAVKP